MALAHSPRIVTDGLVLCLDAGNTKSYPGTGTTWTDLSGQGNNGSLINGVGYSGDNLGSLSFDGADDRTLFSGNNISGLAELATEFTISAWVKYNPFTSGYQAFITKQNSGSSAPGTPRLDLGYFRDQQTLYFTTYNSSSGDLNGANFSYSANNATSWNNYVLVCGNSLKRVYVNNTLYFSDSFTSTYPDNAKLLTIGGDRRINGNIAQVSIYSRALTASEIQQNFNALRSRYQ